MPNWVTNTVKTSIEDFPKLMEALINDDYDVDFNKVVPLSTDLDITSGSGSYETSDKYFPNREQLSVQNEIINPFFKGILTDDMTQAEFVEAVLNALKDREDIKKALQPFVGADIQHIDTYIKGYYNYNKYGFTDWYSAHCALWGTKWNACESEVIEQAQTVVFETAWSMPHPVMVELSKKVPLTIAYADEDIGHNFGIYEYKDGESTCIHDRIIRSFGKLTEKELNMVNVLMAYLLDGSDLEQIFEYMTDKDWFNPHHSEKYYGVKKVDELELMIEKWYNIIYPEVSKYIL